MNEYSTTTTTPSDVAETILKFQGGPYSLADYPMFKAIYNTKKDKVLMRSGRQVSKTVTMAGTMLVEVACTPYYPIIYANASGAQTSSFSTSKLDPFLLHSPVLYSNLMKTKNVINNVYHKRFDNFSEIRLTYFSESADRVRGNTGFHLYLDEIQDMLYDAIIDAEECLSAAPKPRFTYAGTCKTLNNTLEYYWSISTQKEWLIKCNSCNKYNIPSVNNIGKHGLICKKCGASLNTYEGFWYAFNNSDKAIFDGYHIPQIILPLHCCNEDKWQRLLEKFEHYPEHKFLNEVMGLPSGQGASLINEELLRSSCIPDLEMELGRTKKNMRGSQYVAAGIDWGGGGVDGTSRTVLSVYSVNINIPEYTKVYGKIFLDNDFDKQVKDIALILNKFQCNLCCGDAGNGQHAMSQLARLTPTTRIVPVQYTESSAPIRWDDRANKYTVNRTTMIDNFILDLKNKKVKTMRWEEFQPFANDILNVTEEVISNDIGKERRVWRRYPTKPDDSLHSMVFGWLACKILSNDLKFY